MELRNEESVLKIIDLSYSYDGQKKALNNVNLNIYKGEKVAVLGSNGAGKSTFFLNLNGVLKSSHGHIFYKGKEITQKNINELRKNVGIVFQDADNQIIASTVLAEVSFGPMNLKLPKDEVKQRVEEALVEVESFLDEALLANLETVKIIHGIGSGQLRKAVRDKLKKLKFVKSFKDGDYYDGASAVTMVNLK